MEPKNRKTFFLLYPFIGIFNMVKWAVIGLTSTFTFIITTLTDLCIYSIKGVYYILITFPKGLFSKVKIKDDLTNFNFTENQSLASLANNNVKNLNASKNDNSSIMISPQTKKQIIKERQEKFKQEQLNQKQQLKLSKSQNIKLQAEKETLINDLASGDVKRSDKPIAFRYKAIDPTGKIITGTFIGSSKLDVNAFLVNEGFDVYSIKTSKMINFLYGQSNFGTKKMSNKDLNFWLTQLYTYIKSGIPLTDAMRILANQLGKNKSRKKIFEKIIYELTMGSSFSDALAKQNNVFPALLINMLKAAEATGELEETLNDMANYYKDVETTRKQMVSALTYPIIISVFSLGVISFILLYVIPKFTQIYDQAGVELNGFTRNIIYASNFLKNNISVILLIMFAFILVLFLAYKHIKFFRKNIQTLLMHLPIIGKIIIYKEMTIFTKTFASLLKNNVFITDSIEILSKVTNNELYKDIMYNTISNIARGEKISESFKNQWIIPDVAYYMIVTGESTGELAAMMENVSNYYQEQHRSIVSNLKAFIEPIMITLLAVIVGVIILAVIIPMFDLYNSISL